MLLNSEYELDSQDSYDIKKLQVLKVSLTREFNLLKYTNRFSPIKSDSDTSFYSPKAPYKPNFYFDKNKRLYIENINPISLIKGVSLEVSGKFKSKRRLTRRVKRIGSFNNAYGKDSYMLSSNFSDGSFSVKVIISQVITDSPFNVRIRN